MAGRRKIAITTITAVLLIAGVVIISVAIAMARERSNRAACSNALMSLGQAILLYCNENRGSYPPNWGTLATTEDVTMNIFIYPDSVDGIPANMSDSQRQQWIDANGKFIYIGDGLPFGSDSKVVLAYEKPGIRRGGGINILFQDGHVAFFDGPESAKIVKQLEERVNPPHFESAGIYVGTK